MPRQSDGIRYLDTSYSISSTGEVTNTKTWRRLKPQNNGCGYLFVRIRGKTVYIHRMVYQSFSDNNLKDLTINHKDGNKRNNHIDNLELVTREENTRLAQEKCFVVSSPDGKNIVVTGLRKFCIKNNINHQSMVLVAQGKISNHRGWGCSYA